MNVEMLERFMNYLRVWHNVDEVSIDTVNDKIICYVDKEIKFNQSLSKLIEKMLDDFSEL